MIVEEGHLLGEFTGFNTWGTLFRFQNGGVWEQAEHRYVYQYAFMPVARVVDEAGGYRLYVDGMDESVSVRRSV